MADSGMETFGMNLEQSDLSTGSLLVIVVPPSLLISLFEACIITS